MWRQPVAHLHADGRVEVHESVAPRVAQSAQALPTRQATIECVICMEEAQAPQACRRLPCQHEFHAACVDRWLRVSNTCPTCRTSNSQVDPTVLATLEALGQWWRHV